MNEHHHGILLSVISGLAGTLGAFAYWFVHNIQAIDGLAYFILLCVSITGAVIGLRKVRK